MTAYAIVSAPREQRAFVTSNLVGFVHDVITGGGRVYVISRVNRRDKDMAFVDPIDGALLIECRFFDDESAARQWVTTDIALHAAPTRRVQ